MTKGVCVLGDTAVDLIVRLPEINNGVKVMAHAPNLNPGGSGANSAVALARLGITTYFIGTVGKDQYGQVVEQDFIKEKVEIDQLFVEPTLNTVCVFAFIDQDGERFLWGWPKENASFISIEFERINLDRIKETGWLHTTGILLGIESSGRDTTLKTLEWAHKNGVTTSLDLNLRVGESGQALGKEFYDVVMNAVSNSNYVLGSDQEFSLLDPSHNWEKAAEKLAKLEKVAVVRRGKEGSVLIAGDQRVSSLAFEVDVVDTIGAGDIFDAGFIAAILKNHDFSTALQWGNAVAGYTISMEGARTSPTFEQMKGFIRKKIG
ncbi:MAG: carbohydrate kinase family protein [Chloroflexi bacterium]|nr:carbohydrate kinase family protein [Chloroflexota bacterium]